jgi:transposase InsO family protein
MLNQMYRRIKLPEGVVYFFGLMKSELLYSGKYTSADTFIKDLVEYIECYNNERIKLRLNGMSPVQYRKMLTASIV